MGNKHGRQRRQLRNFLIDRGVQLKITAVMVLLMCVLTAGLGYFWYAEMREASTVIRVNALSSMGEDGANQLASELASQDHTRLLLLVGFALLLAVLIAGYGIVMTHKIAGPIFKITRHISDIEGNRLYELWDLRKGDQLQEFFASFKAMHGALRARTEEDMQLLSKLIAEIEKADEVSKELVDLLPRLKEALGEKGDSLRDASDTTQQIKRDTV